MKTIPRHLKAISLVLVSVLTAPFALAQTTPSENSSGAISVDRSAHYIQTDYGQVALEQSPFNFTFHVRGGSETLKANWGPKFYKPGSAGVVQSGSSSATNTGTLNFPNTPNNGSDFMFIHEFDNDDAMLSFYPIAPTDGGQYGVKFLGTPPAESAVFTDGLVYAAGITYPTTVPQIVAPSTPEEVADANGASWSGGKLQVKASGLTTLKLNSFTQYDSTTYGSLIAVGIYDSFTGEVISEPSTTSYYLPVGDSTEDPDPIIQPAITEITLEGSWLVPGKTYTMELQYAIIAGRPEEATLGGTEFQGVSSFRRVTTLNVVAVAQKLVHADYTGDGVDDVLWRNDWTGQLAHGAQGSYSSLGYEGGSGWVFAGIGNFDADNLAEVAFRNESTGLVASWTTSGAMKTLGSEGSGWTFRTIGDCDGDGIDEAIWRNENTGEFKSWTSGGTIRSLGVEGNGWGVLGVGDFDGDNRAELVWRNANTGLIAAWTVDGSRVTLGTEGNGWTVEGVGDFDGDGLDECLWRQTPSGLVAAFTASGTMITLGAEGSGWLLAGVGDFDGDNRDEAIWQRTTTGQVAAWTAAGAYLDYGIGVSGWRLQE